jgi:hypothetical protein
LSPSQIHYFVNIRHFEPIENKGHGLAQDVAFLSRIVLTGAYFISVTYYLQLLAAFLLNAFDVNSQIGAHVITTILLLIIGGIGIWRGLNELEAVEICHRFESWHDWSATC